MKRWIFLLCCWLAYGPAASGYLRIEGTPVWSVTKPDCTLEVIGAIQNIAPSNTSSGYLKLALWATVGAFPSQGVQVAEAGVGPLRGGGQVLDFRDKVAADLGDLTGEYQFTIVLMEYLGGRWYNRVAVPSGRATLDRGDFLEGGEWVFRTRGYKRPRGVKAGQMLRLTTRANASFQRIERGTEANLLIRFTDDVNATLKRGSSSGAATYGYQRRRDSLKGRRFRSGRVSIFSGEVREAEIVLFFRNARKGVYRMTGGGRVSWGDFVLR